MNILLVTDKSTTHLSRLYLCVLINRISFHPGFKYSRNVIDGPKILASQTYLCHLMNVSYFAFVLQPCLVFSTKAKFELIDFRSVINRQEDKLISLNFHSYFLLNGLICEKDLFHISLYDLFFSLSLSK